MQNVNAPAEIMTSPPTGAPRTPVTPSKQQLHAWQPRGDRLNAAILTSEETEASAGGYPSSWEKVRLGEAAEIFVGFAFEAKQFTPAGVRLLRGVNIGIGRTKWEDTVLIEHSASPPDYLLRPGDIVVAMDRPFISGGFRVAQLTDEDTPSYLVQRVARLRPAGAATGDYVYTFLTSARFHRHLTARVTGTSVPHISGIDIGSAWMPLPPLQEQAELTHRVAQAFKRIKAVEALVTTQQNQLAEFDQAILAKAFRGELVPQDPNDEPAAVLLERIRAARAEASAAPRRRGRVTREEAAPAVEVPAEPTRASPRPSTTAATELDPDLLQSHVFAALWTHGPLDKDAAVRRLADHLRQAGVVDYQRLRADGPLYATLLAALESAARAGLLDRPGRGLLRASKPDPTAYTTDDWRHALLATLPPTPTDRDQAIRAAADWSRHHLGLEFTRLPTDGHIATGLRSAINSAIRRHEITRHSPTLISRAQNKTQLPLPLAPPTPRRP
jgi:hypothetical protein